MGNLVKMQIIGCKDSAFKEEAGKFTVLFNPDTLKYTKGIHYSTKNKPQGNQHRQLPYAGHEPDSLSFTIVLDTTGIAGEVKWKLTDKINLLQDVAFDIKGGIHEPNYIKISWGSFLFKGRMKSLNYEYNLFTPEGAPLRVKISCTVAGSMDRLTAAKKANLQSPDLSRIITLKAGESIPYWCNEIYGDASYCIDIASYNKLSNFRNVKPGTQLMFPPLIRNEKL